MAKHDLIHFSKETTENILSMYKEGESAVKISKSLGISYTPIYRVLRENNITLRNAEQRIKKYKLNDSVFDVIDSEEKAYWLGILFSDGCVHKDTISLSLVESDLNVISRFRSFLETDSPIKTTYPKLGKPQYSLHIFSKRL